MVAKGLRFTHYNSEAHNNIIDIVNNYSVNHKFIITTTHEVQQCKPKLTTVWGLKKHLHMHYCWLSLIKKNWSTSQAGHTLLSQHIHHLIFSIPLNINRGEPLTLYPLCCDTNRLYFPSTAQHSQGTTNNLGSEVSSRAKLDPLAHQSAWAEAIIPPK